MAVSTARPPFPVLARVPHVLSATRVGLTAVTYFAALRQDRPLFAVLVLLGVITDILDGPIARATGSASRFGANLDSAADLLFYVSLPAWAYLFDPAIVTQNLPLVLTLGILYVAGNLLSHATFGALGVHNRLSRASGTAGIVFTFYSILWGIQPVLKWLLLLILIADLAQRYAAVFRHWMRKQAPNA